MKAAKEDFPHQLRTQLTKAGVNPETVKGQFQRAFALRMNHRPWRPVKREFEFDGQEYCSKQVPAAAMQDKGRGIFLTDYQGRGVSCADTQNLKHATNLWRSEFSIGKKQAFVGIRHGIHAPVGEKDKAKRQEGARVKAQESILAALAAKPGILKQALIAGEDKKAEVPTLLTSSTSVVTTGMGSGKEKKMQQMQDEAFAAFVQKKQPITLQVPGEDGKLRDVTFKLVQPSMNIPVNWGGVGPASIITGGRRYEGRKNNQAIDQWFGKRNKKTTKREGGLIQEFLENQNIQTEKLQKAIKENQAAGESTSTLEQELIDIRRQNERVQDLAKQTYKIYAKGQHHHEYHDAYKLAARMVLLTYMVGGVPLYNCKSGKDRTGMLDAEVKFLAARMERDKEVPQPGKIAKAEDRALFRKILLESGNLEVQEYNVGVRGYKTEKIASIDERIADPEARKEVRGLSKSVGS